MTAKFVGCEMLHLDGRRKFITCENMLGSSAAV